MKTEEVCLAAVAQNQANAVLYLPESFQSVHQVPVLPRNDCFDNAYIDKNLLESEYLPTFLRGSIGDLGRVIAEMEALFSQLDLSKVNPMLWLMVTLIKPRLLPTSILAAPFEIVK